jgi:hypothetical protein
MPTIAIIAVAVLLYRAHPALFAWNATGFHTFLAFAVVIATVAFWRRN